jgi:hypothetical protein
MKQNLIIVGLTLSSMLFSCSKSSPTPSNNNGGTGGTVGGGTSGTTYTPISSQSVNTSSAAIYFDNNQNITGTLSDIATGKGIKTASGGDISFSLINLKQADITSVDVISNSGIVVNLTNSADPVLEYLNVKDDITKTITAKVDIHFNSVAASILVLQGSSFSAHDASYYTAAKITSLLGDKFQKIENFVP